MAREFDGANSKVAATIGDLSFAAFTFIACVYARSAGEASTGRIMRTEQLGGTVAELESVAGPVLRFNTNCNTINAEATASTALTVNTWFTVAATLTFPGLIPAVYQGGMSSAMAEVSYSVGPVQGSSQLQTAGNGMVVGNRSDQTGTFDGYIAYPTVYARLLTLDEMEQFRRGYLPTAATYYWPLTQHDVTQSYEYITGANGTDTTTTYADDPRPMRFNRRPFRQPFARPAPFKPGKVVYRTAASPGMNL